jgi:hypothetical protein
VDKVLWAVIITDSGVARSTVLRVCAEIDPQVAAFRTRTLEHLAFRYVYLDAYVKARVDHRTVSRAVVVATGVAKNGNRVVLGVDVGDSEDEVFWTAFPRSLKHRWLRGVKLVSSPNTPCRPPGPATRGRRHARNGASQGRRAARRGRGRRDRPRRLPAGAPQEDRRDQQQGDQAARQRVRDLPRRHRGHPSVGAVRLEVHDDWQPTDRRYLSEASVRQIDQPPTRELTTGPHHELPAS